MSEDSYTPVYLQIEMPRGGRVAGRETAFSLLFALNKVFYHMAFEDVSDEDKLKAVNAFTMLHGTASQQVKP